MICLRQNSIFLEEENALVHTFEHIAGTNSFQRVPAHKKVLLIPTCPHAMHKLGFYNQWLNAQNDMALFDKAFRKRFYLFGQTSRNVMATLELFVDGSMEWRNNFTGQHLWNHGNWIIVQGVLIIKFTSIVETTTIHFFEPMVGTDIYVRSFSKNKDILVPVADVCPESDWLVVDPFDNPSI